MATREGISVTAVALAGVGAVGVYAAVKGVGLGSGVRTLLGGQPIQQVEDLTLSAAPSGPSVPAGSGGSIVAAAMKYKDSGTKYRWGSANPTDGWDCSGFTNYVLGHDLGLPIPGYPHGFDGSSHGPVTWQWPPWTGAYTIPRDQVAGGDLVVWPLFHMGIAVDNQQMINAPGPNGTPAPVLGRIDGASHGPLVCLRLGSRGLPAGRAQ